MSVPFTGDGVDLTRANAARMYDYLLGGGHNFEVDRQLAADMLDGYPDVARAARANRSFLGEAVRWCLARGIDQFLDLGSGVPTVGNVHEIAHATEPSARVAYVDIEPVAVAHAREIIAGRPHVTVTQADLRDPEAVLGAPGVAELIDPGRPVAVLMVAVLHFVPDGVDELVARYVRDLPAGSVLVVSHDSDDQDDPELGAHIFAMIEAFRGTASELTLRSRAELRRMIGELELVEPGLVDVARWFRPAEGSSAVGIYGLLARVA